ncbi:ATP-binding protein [Streptomyces mangrovisoli]|uniref:Histidine kinase/HSP90-like ATPase domain-containing protein n=1 Tax=Streptomyces mangrovisoli TaxID=1428628 RepID=A0A1J4NN74_9ACTN|nr:ATP-binding protein [Streptomyces mangrovisoli]OIJ63586.1 hypothetical protein WN71_032700 [Streptomyces mangrovisoli]
MPTRDRRPCIELVLVPHPAAAAQARRAVAVVARHDQEIVERGQLLVTEAVANVVKHTDSARVRVKLAADRGSGSVFCAVYDDDPDTPENGATGRPQAADCADARLAESGRGLHLLESESDDWGWAQVDCGKWLWFHLHPADDPVCGA